MKKESQKRLNFSSFAVLFAFILCSFNALDMQAQRTITGTITGDDGSPLPGVNVLQKGTSNGVGADFNGNYTINLIPGDQTLVFSFVGYESKEVVVGESNTLNVVLQEDSQSLSEVVIIGYAPVAREKVLGALASVKSEELAKATPVNAFDAVQGRLAGVQILNNGGPGAGFDVTIRGVATFSAGTSPLFVVDGQQLENIDNIDPNDIATFEVLKDGATAAIYGSRGANGVILITTKSGKAGEVRFDITSNTSYTTLNGQIPLANTRQRLLYESDRRTNNTTLTGNDRDSLSLLNRNSFDLQDLLTRTAKRQIVNLSVSGGSDKIRALWNVGFQDQEGVVVNSSYKRINSRLKLDFDATSKFKLGTNINISFEDQFGLNENQVFQQTVERIAYFPVFEPNGTFTPEIAGRQNPLAEANLRTTRNRNFRSTIFNYAQFNFTPELSIRSNLGINFRFQKRNDFEPILTQNPNSPFPRGRERRGLSYDIQQENIINYNDTFGDHTLGAFAGMQTQKYFREGSDIAALFVSDAIQTFNNVDPTTLAVNISGTTDTRNNLFSLFGGVNYDYKNKYLVGFTLRRDGSSRFGDAQEYGTFPSYTLGWRVSKEDFMENAKDVVNNLMIRFGYGETGNQNFSGNQNIGNYDFTSAYLPGFTYDGVSGVAPTRLGNPNLSWESTTSTNLGIDLGMFKNRLTIAFDIWKKETDDLLASVPLPEESGFSSIRQNVGGLKNTGIDLSVNGTIIQTENFTWNSGFNISTLKNEVTRLNGGIPFQSGDYLIEEGQPLGNIWGFRNLGVYQYDESNAYDENGTRLTPNFDDGGAFVNYTLNGQDYTGTVRQLRNSGRVLEGGDIIWDDVNNDLDINNSDRQTIGNGLPELFGGFSSDFTYKNLSLSFLFDFTFGNDLWRRYDELRNDLNSSNETPGPLRIENAWRNQGDVTVYPRLNRVPQNRERPNSFFVTPGDFVRLRFVRLNYNMPQTLLEKVNWVSNVSFNLSLNNFFTWTNYPGYNPELGTRGNPLQPGLDNLRYPNAREVIFGVRVQL